MSSPADDTSVQVALRIRPQSASEKIDMCHICTSVTPGHPQVILGKDKAFTYDFVFDVDSIQPSIYEAVGKPLIEGTFDGYNATILAYGQTGSGKTYTMGTSFDVSIPLDLIGIIPRAAQHLFDGITKRREKAEEDGKPLPEFKVSAQFLELYNEEIVDLLDIENKGRKNIKVHEDHNGNIYLTGIVSKAVSSAQDIMDLLEEGAISRTTAATNMNATSSRSHAIFTLLVKHYRLAPSGQDSEDGGGGGDDEFETLNAKFNFVDLAGSERLKRTGATGDRAKEGISINQGLLSLGNVISALGDKTKRGCHVPYRDSKLTRLLQDSLGGNSRTLMIACVSPSDRDFMETLNTLKYANRARNIKNKVMVNQDKASKQIAMLRQEIQELTLELLEYKQGKRVADGSGEHMTDTFRELEMLRIENDNLRMRMKALQKNIDSQTIQLTELKVTSALSCISEENKSSVEEIVKKYEKDIQELSNKLRESEAMSSAAVRRAQTVSRMAMSPSSVSMSHDDDFNEIINVAKQELKKEKKKKKKLRKKIKSPTSEDGPIPMELDAEKTDTQKEDETTDEKNIKNNDDNNVIVISDEDDDNENNSQQNGIESEEELEHDEDEEDDDDEDDVLESNTDSDTDDELNQSLKDEKILQDNINELDTDITIKQRLIDELEHSQQRLTAMKHQYELKLNLLHNKIKETEVERDKVLKSIGSVDSKAKEKSDEVRRRFEKKLQTMQKELSKLQNAKREHQRLLKTKEQNEQQLKMLRNEMSDMKKMKVKLMHQMRDEASRNKHKEDKLNRQMEAVLKENRKKEVEIKRMKDEKKQRDLVLKRKNEELNAMRRQAKPVSGNISTRSSRNANRPNNLQLQYQNNPSSSLNTTFVLETNENGHDNDVQRTPTKRMIPTALKGTRSPAVSKRAKQKWEILDRKITELQIRMKNVVQKENDMERWITDRERIGKQLETARKRVEDYEKHGVTQDDAVLKELVNQVEGLEAHMEYIQENIMESQGTIMSMEEEGEGINPHELITGCSATETKYILEHFYSKSVETAQELANKDAAYKQIQIKLEAMETHCEIQQQLLQHACILEFGAASEDQFDNEIPESEDILPDISNVTNVTRKARRKTALPEELLHPKDNKANKNNQPKVIEIIDIGSSDEQTSTNTNTNTKEKENKSPVGTSESKNKNVAETFKLDEKTLQKLYDLEKSLQDRKKMPPPATAPSSGRERSGSFSESAENQTASSVALFQRNSRITRSARPFSKSASASNIKHNVKRSSSNKNSPLLERRTIGESTPSSLGQILPSKSSMGKPSSLVCLYTATGHNNAVLSLDVTEDLMVTGSKDRTAKVWDLKSSEEILSLSQHKRDVTCVKFCPSKHLVFTVYQSTIKIWDIRTGNVVKTLSGGLFQSMGESSVMDLGLNSDGTVLYSAIGNTVKMIDLKTYSTLGKLSGHTGSVSCLLVVDTGHHHDNVITGSKDHFVKIFEVVDEVPGSQMPRQNLEPPHYDGVQSLAIKDKYLFSGSRDNTIKKWNYNNHNLEQHMVSAHKDWVMALDFVPDRNVLISGDRRGIMKLWDVQSCKQISEVAAHGKSINSIKCNSSMIFTASSDRLVRLWKPCETLDEQLDELS